MVLGVIIGAVLGAVIGYVIGWFIQLFHGLDIPDAAAFLDDRLEFPDLFLALVALVEMQPRAHDSRLQDGGKSPVEGGQRTFSDLIAHGLQQYDVIHLALEKYVSGNLLKPRRNYAFLELEIFGSKLFKCRYDEDAGIRCNIRDHVAGLGDVPEGRGVPVHSYKNTVAMSHDAHWCGIGHAVQGNRRNDDLGDAIPDNIVDVNEHALTPSSHSKER